MPLYEGSHETILPASPEAAFAVLTDYEHLPDWQGPLRRCQVLSRYDDGLGREVRYDVDVKVRRVSYTLRHDYDRPGRIGSEYVEGDFRRFQGDWELQPHGDGGARTAARLSLRIDPGLPLPGRIVRMLHERVLRTSVEDLRRRLERG
jgi:ribosome-associated toxin RatA of RatAB toxin-antitoxin module